MENKLFNEPVQTQLFALFESLKLSLYRALSSLFNDFLLLKLNILLNSNFENIKTRSSLALKKTSDNSAYQVNNSQQATKEKRRRQAITQEFQSGVVSSLQKEFNYGTLCTVSKQQVYFHSTSFDEDIYHQLEIGSRLIFVMGEGPLGPQALHIRSAPNET